SGAHVLSLLCSQVIRFIGGTDGGYRYRIRKQDVSFGLLLAVLHGIECGIWAAAYLWLGALDSPTDALLYSVDAMSTRGASGLTLQRPWQMMGALEAVNGMLLFGISTAYVFAVMQVYWSMLAKYVTSSQG